MDQFSPTTPARVRALVLPVGEIEGSRFSLFLHRLQKESSIIPLTDLGEYVGNEEFQLSPKRFPQGFLLYNFTSAALPVHQQQLSPFELFREPLIVLGICNKPSGDDVGDSKDLDHAAAYLRECYPRVVYRQLLVLEDNGDAITAAASNAIVVPRAGHNNDSTLKKAICTLSARFLKELTTYTTALRASPSIQTPGQTARSLQRTNSLRDSDRRPTSGYSTPAQSTDTTSPVDDGSPSRPSSRNRGPIPTSFDHIASANNIPSALARSDSRTSNRASQIKNDKRASSQDRVSVQGFGSATSQERARARGSARVGIVIGSVSLMAGHWSEALRILVDNTTRLRSMSDHLWHAKGLELITVSLTLLAWANVDFQIPSICVTATERTSSIQSVRLPTLDVKSQDKTPQNVVHRLSQCIPDLSKLILSLYRSIEGSLELPFLVIAEATVRLSKLMAILAVFDGKLTPHGLKMLVTDLEERDSEIEISASTSKRLTTTSDIRNWLRIHTADLLAQASPHNEEALFIGDHIRILTGSISTYSLLGLQRKKAIAVKELVVRLTRAVIQARKLGSAEMGIHPAASLSMDTGAESLVAAAEYSGSMNELMADVAQVYGIGPILDPSYQNKIALDITSSDNHNLKVNFLRDLVAFCEASPDPYGILRLAPTLLRFGGPNALLESTSDMINETISKEEQMHLATVINRTVGVAKQIGLPDAQATYWDPLLICGIEFRPPKSDLAVIERSHLRSFEHVAEPHVSANPLLYDPHANKLGIAGPQTFTLVEQEVSLCIITLQNRFDIPVEIESLDLVVDGAELETQHEPITLGPLRIQRVSVSVCPKTTGDFTLQGCQIKMQGCREEFFPILTDLQSAKCPDTLKEQGLFAQPQHLETETATTTPSWDQTTVLATVVDPMPYLENSDASLIESGIMLLEGEKRTVELSLSNPSNIAAYIFEIEDTNNVLHFEKSLKSNGSEAGLRTPMGPRDAMIGPKTIATFRFILDGKAGVSNTELHIYYCAAGSNISKYARFVSIPLKLTVNAGLQIHHINAIPSYDADDETQFIINFDIGNAWPKTISYDCATLDMTPGDQNPTRLPQIEGSLAPGEIRRVNLRIPRSAKNLSLEIDDGLVRQDLFSRIRIAWAVDEREGIVDLSGLTLSQEILRLIRGQPVDLSIDIAESKATVASSDHNCKYETTVGSFVSVRVKFQDHVNQHGPWSIQLATGTLGVGRDEKRVAFAGTPQVFLPKISMNGQAAVDFVVCPLLSGILQLVATVRTLDIEQKGVDSKCSINKSVSLAVRPS